MTLIKDLAERIQLFTNNKLTKKEFEFVKQALKVAYSSGKSDGVWSSLKNEILAGAKARELLK